VSANINLPANSLASNFEVMAVLWNKKGVKYEFVNVHGTADMAGVLTSISEKINEEFNFQVTNSSKTDIGFQFSTALMRFKNITINLRDILGRTIQQQREVQLTNDLQTLHFSNLNLVTGTYILSFESSEFIVSRKVLVE
jgi:hypothetical protein